MMKKDITVYVNSKTSMVDLHSSRLGISGENLQGNLIVKFDDKFVNGTAILEIQRNNEKYYLVMQKENESYYLPILSSLLSETTTIIMQIRITEGTDDESIPVWKSNKFYLKVEEAINAEIPIPQEYAEWIDIANEKLNEIDNLDIDITTEDENTKVIITRKDGSTKEVVVSGGGGAIDDVKVNNVSVVSNRIANIDLTSYVQDNNYVHTDNNYTDSEKIKLSNLFNYDDTEIRNTLNNKADKNEIPTKTSDLTNDSGFITGYTETDPTVPSHVKNITQANITSWNNKLDSSKVKNTNSTTAGDVYDVIYINTMIGDVETVLTTLTTGSGV